MSSPEKPPKWFLFSFALVYAVFFFGSAYLAGVLCVWLIGVLNPATWEPYSLAFVLGTFWIGGTDWLSTRLTKRLARKPLDDQTRH